MFRNIKNIFASSILLPNSVDESLGEICSQSMMLLMESCIHWSPIALNHSVCEPIIIGNFFDVYLMIPFYFPPEHII